MKKILLSCVALISLGTLNAQQIQMLPKDIQFEPAAQLIKKVGQQVSEGPGQFAPAGIAATNHFLKHRNSMDTCGVDTLEYLINKNTTLEWYYLADTAFAATPSSDAHDYYSRYAQYYEAPQAIDVYGAAFYAYVFSAGDSAEVTVSLYTAASDSFPDQLISQKSVWVYDDYSATNINVMKQRVEFDSVITMNQHYLIAIETSTTEQLLVLSNSFTNQDGAGEELSFSYYSNPTYPTFHGWYDQFHFLANWDFDWIIEPIVDYQLIPSFTLNVDDICAGDSVCVMNTTADSVVRHHMYNPNAPLGGMDFSWGDGNQTMGDLSTCYTYATAGEYYIDLTETSGWTAACSHVVRDTVVVNPLPVANFSYVDNLGGSITFSDLSSNADSIQWDLGVGITSTDSTFNYTYNPTDSAYTVTLIAYGECGNDTTMQVIVPDPTSVEDYLSDITSVYPNPTNNLVNISIASQDEVQLSVLSITGEQLKTYTIRQSAVVELGDLSDGVYLLKFSQGSSTGIKRLVVNSGQRF